MKNVGSEFHSVFLVRRNTAAAGLLGPSLTFAAYVESSQIYTGKRAKRIVYRRGSNKNVRVLTRS